MRKAISISLAVLLLLGNFGFTYGTHYCGGHAVINEVMMGEKHLDCGMAMMEMPEHSTENQHLSKPPCCENEYLAMEVDELFKTDVCSQLAPIAVTTTIASLLYLVPSIEHVPVTIPVDTSPPLSCQDFQVLHQVFRI